MNIEKILSIEELEDQFLRLKEVFNLEMTYESVLDKNAYLVEISNRTYFTTDEEEELKSIKRRIETISPGYLIKMECSDFGNDTLVVIGFKKYNYIN